MNPPTLKGSEGLITTEERTADLEQIFEYLDYNDNQRLSCVVFQLAKDAKY